MYKLKELEQFQIITFGAKVSLFLVHHRSTPCVSEGDVIDTFLKPETRFSLSCDLCNER